MPKLKINKKNNSYCICIYIFKNSNLNIPKIKILIFKKGMLINFAGIIVKKIKKNKSVSIFVLKKKAKSKN
jgi:hypothetical protein